MPRRSRCPAAPSNGLRCAPPNGPSPLPHGAGALPWGVSVDAYNAEIRAEDGGFLGDKASNRAFEAMLAYWRDTLRKVDEGPLGGTPTQAIGRRPLDR